MENCFFRLFCVGYRRVIGDQFGFEKNVDESSAPPYLRIASTYNRRVTQIICSPQFSIPFPVLTLVHSALFACYPSLVSGWSFNTKSRSISCA
jgi:hypothetical protein